MIEFLINRICYCVQIVLANHVQKFCLLFHVQVKLLLKNKYFMLHQTLKFGIMIENVDFDFKKMHEIYISLNLWKGFFVEKFFFLLFEACIYIMKGYMRNRGSSTTSTCVKNNCYECSSSAISHHTIDFNLFTEYFQTFLSIEH